jgi:hypothetical protein
VANKLKVWEIEDETGQVYQIEGPDDATDEELFAALNDHVSAPASTPVSPTEPNVGPVAASAPAGPSGVQPTQTAQRPVNDGAQFEMGVENMAAADVTDPEWMTTEERTRIGAMMDDPQYSFEQINQAVGELATQKGLPSVGIAGSREQLDAYRQSIAQGGERSLPGYEDWKSGLRAPEATATADSEFGRGYQDAAQYGTPGWIARTYHDWIGTGMDELRQRFPNATPDQLESLQEDVINYVQRGVREQNIKATENDGMVPWLAGQLLASAGVEDFVPGGQFVGQGARGVAKRAGVAAGVNTGADMGYQAGDIAAGVQDGYNVEQTLLAPVLGAGLHGAVEGSAAIARTVRRTREDPRPAPEPREAIPTPTSRKNSKAYRTEIAQTAQGIADHISDVADGWTNAPEFEVHQNFKAIEGVDNDAIGVTLPDGRVLINSEELLAQAESMRVSPEDMATAVTFHEALGHFGLSQKFGDDLDQLLINFIDNGSTTFRNKVDTWLENHKDAYLDSPMRDVRAAEELLAEWSEQGRMPVTFVNRITNLVKDFARQAGINLKFSEREIRTILGMAHNAVVNGKGRDVRANGFRYMYTGLAGNQVGPNERGFYEAPAGYEKAVQRGEAGESVSAGSQVHKDTGWFLGPDRRWRMEIDDSNAQYDLDFSEVGKDVSLTMEEVLDHPALFDLYPDLRQVRVIRQAPLLDIFRNFQGSFNPDTNTINISPHAKDPEGTLMHEIQHWVQDKESFSSGGNPSTALKRIPPKKLMKLSNKVIKYYRKEAEKLKIKAEAFKVAAKDPIVSHYTKMYGEWRKTMGLPSDSPEAMLAYKLMSTAQDDVYEHLTGIRNYNDIPKATRDEAFEIVYNAKPGKDGVSGLVEAAEEFETDAGNYTKIADDVAEALNRFENGLDANTGTLQDALSEAEGLPFQAYQHLFGEVEARDTANRRTMSEGERRQTTPYTSENEIEPNDYIFDRGLGPVEALSSEGPIDFTKIKNQRDFDKSMKEMQSRYEMVDRLHDAIKTNRFTPDSTDELVSIVQDYILAARVLEEDNPPGAHALGLVLNKTLDLLDDAINITHNRINGTANDNNRYMKKKAVSDEEAALNAKEILQGVLDNYEPTSRSWAEAKRAARDRGLTAKQIRKAKGIGDLDKRLFQYDAVADATDQKLVALHEKMNNGTFTVRDKAAYLETIYSYNELMGRIFDDQAEIGRALNAMKALDFTKRKITDLNKILEEFQGNNIKAFADDNIFNEFADQVRYLMETQNANGAHAMLKNVVKPYWWQYILSFRHAAMLSGLGTHAKNAADNAMMIARELEETAMALPGSLIRAPLRAAGLNVKDGVSPQEVAARMYGLLRSALDSNTYANTFTAFKEGHENTPHSSKIEMQDAHIPGVSKVQDALHAADTFFRSFHMNANLYTLGVRKARAEGFKGLAAFEEGSNLASNPTIDMIDEAKRLTDVALLVDTPSTPSAKLEAAKAIKPNMKAGEQLTAFVANLVFPFFRVTDRLLFQKLRRSPLAFLDHVTRQDLAAGGARMDIAIARMTYGSALIYYYWQAAGEGKTEGEAPSDYDKRQALEAGGYLPNSVKEDGKFVDASALNLSLLPADLQNSVAANIASIRKAYDTSKADADSTAEALGYAALSLFSVLASNSFAENISTYLEPFQASEGMSRDTAIANVAGGFASQFVPAAVRQYNQMYYDKSRRDTVGDKSIPDRIYGRVASAIPGLSNELPQRYDVYGDPMEYGRTASSISNYQNIKDDEVSTELQSLEATTESAVVVGAPSSFQHEGERITLTADGKQEWQRVQGYYLRYWMEEEIRSPEWRTMTTEEKIARVKEVRKDAYDETKQYMLPLLGVTPSEEE